MVLACGWAVRFERSVSGRPGAEGAPRSRLDEDLLVLESLLTEVLLVEVGCVDAGAIRRDCLIDCVVSSNALTHFGLRIDLSHESLQDVSTSEEENIRVNRIPF